MKNVLFGFLTCVATATVLHAGIVRDFEPPTSNYVKVHGVNNSSGVARTSVPGEPAIDTKSAFLSVTEYASGGVDDVYAYAGSIEGDFCSLGDITSLGFQAYLVSGNPALYVPYIRLNLDVNGNGIFDGQSSGDAVVIAQQMDGTPVLGQWTAITANGDNLFKISKDGTDVVSDVTFSNLLGLEYNGTKYGDMDVLGVFAQVGSWNADGYSYAVYVDNLAIIPEPATMALLSLGAVLLRKRK